MPLYTYRCNDCDHEFEVRQRMMDDPITTCPVCGGTVRRVVSSVGVVFKGSGFYVTDNRTSSANGSSKSSSHAKSSDNGGSDATSGSTKSSEAAESSPSTATESSSKSGSAESASSG